MTDNELAAELEFYKGNEDLISPDLISKASERIYALSAHVALLKASLAQAERKAEKPAASAEPSEDLVRFCPGCGHVGPSPDGYLDCCSDGDKARSLPMALAEICHELFVLALKDGRTWGSNKSDVTGEVERLRKALAASCEDEREQLYEAGPFAGGCARATEAEAEVERLRALLSEAADEIQNWGAYASEYFQEKHDLAGCVGKYRAAALAGKEAQS